MTVPVPLLSDDASDADQLVTSEPGEFALRSGRIRWEVEWIPQTELAAALELTPRHVRDLDARGIPHRGEGHAKRYAWPDAMAWHAYYRHRFEQSGRRGPWEWREEIPLEAARDWYEERSARSRAFSRVLYEAWEDRRVPKGEQEYFQTRRAPIAADVVRLAVGRAIKGSNAWGDPLDPYAATFVDMAAAALRDGRDMPLPRG